MYPSNFAASDTEPSTAKIRSSSACIPCIKQGGKESVPQWVSKFMRDEINKPNVGKKINKKKKGKWVLPK